jgi:hypothetical protein
VDYKKKFKLIKPVNKMLAAKGLEVGKGDSENTKVTYAG